MIKNLRSIFVVALLAVSGSMFAQETTEPKGEVIDFVSFYTNLNASVKSDVTDKKGNESYYLTKHPIEQNGISVVFDKATGSGAPTFRVKIGEGETTNPNIGKPDNFIKLYGGAINGAPCADGNTMTFKADKNITKIALAASSATQWGSIKANCGTITMSGANPDATPARGDIDPTWTNVENGKTIDVKEVVFTIYRDINKNETQSVRYAKATVYTADGSTTGINNITADKAQKGVRYNLAGQRVSKDFKGVVIENGKKMIVK